MKYKMYPRIFLFVLLVAGLCAGLVTPRVERVEAKPLAAASPLDVIISEVAWGGTAASSSDEWIELYNATGADINLSGWTLAASDGNPNIPLSGTIFAGGYYLIECGDDNTISDIAADQVQSSSCSFSNGGEVLTLKDSASNIIDTANNDGTLTWESGSGSPTYVSMERIGVIADGAGAWASNNGTTKNGKAADGIADINGTPGQLNSTALTADLAVSVTVSPVSPAAGSVAVFTITITNNGSDDANNVKVNVVLDANLSSPSFFTINGAYDSGTGIWSLADPLTTASPATLEVTATITALPVTVSSAIVSSDKFDTDVSNNSNKITVGTSELTITNKVNGADSITTSVGASVVHTITVTNAGPDTATNIKVEDTWGLAATQVAYISYSATAGTYVYDNVSKKGTWTITSLGLTSVSITITVKVNADGTKTNEAEIKSVDQTDPPPNDIDKEDAIINTSGGEADLVLIPMPITVSTTVPGQVTLQVKILNKGPYTATNIQVRDELPEGLDYVSYTATTGTYSNSTAIWKIESLDVGKDATLNIVVKVAESGTSTRHFAEVWRSDQHDATSSPGNGEKGEDDETFVEVPISDLSIFESVSVSGSDTSGTAVFTIRVVNYGPDAASGVKVKVKNLPPFTTAPYTILSHGETPGTTYSDITGYWEVDSLSSGASATLTITTSYSASPIVNWVEISSAGQVDPDSVPGNESKAEDDDAGAPSADLTLSMTATVVVDPPDPSNVVTDSNLITYTLTVTNNGPVSTTNVEVKDLLPSSSLKYVKVVSASVGTYSSSTGIWKVGALTSGASAALQLQAKAVAFGRLTNSAEVWKSTESDPDSEPADGSTSDDDDASVSVVTKRAIVINEVAWAGTYENPEDEWLELYNPSGADMTITNWKLKIDNRNCSDTAGDYIKLGSASGKIVKGGYYLLERGRNKVVSDVVEDQIYTASALSDGGATLYLCDDAGHLIDTANYEGSIAWPSGSTSSYRPTMERINNTSPEKDENWITNQGVTKNGHNVDYELIYGTPKKANSTLIITPTPLIPTKVPAIVRPIINEFLPRPGYDWNQDGRVDVFDEFIEIKNIGIVDVPLEGWSLDDEENAGSTPFDLPNVTLKPGERAIYYASETNILLSDGGDTVRLISPTNKIYDTYTYAIAKVEDESICRLPDGNGSWYEDCTPTPNQTNTRDGVVPIMPDESYDSPVCSLPDTLPADFLFAECRGYGANIWQRMFWDAGGWFDVFPVPGGANKHESFVE